MGLPEQTQPFPAGLQFSAGMPGKGPQLTRGITVTAKALAKLEPNYEFVGEGPVTINGAKAAAFLRFRRDFDYQGRTVRLEQLSLFVQVTDDVTTTIRFLAPAGSWEPAMRSTYQSVAVVP